MKKYIFIFSLLIAYNAVANPITDPQKDTVIIKIGADSQLMVITESKDEIKKLSEYDLNALMQELETTMENDSGTYYMEMKDLEGKKYLKNDQSASNPTDDSNLSFEERMERFEDRMKTFENKMDEIDGDYHTEDEDNDYDHDNGNYSSSHSESVHFNDHSGTSYALNIDFGINNYLQNGKFPDNNNELYSVKPFGSWNIALNWVNSNRIAGPLYLQWGPGISWYNFKYEDTDVRIQKTDSEVNFYQVDADVNSIKSKLVASYINIQLMPILDFGKRRGYDKFSFIEKTSNSFRVGVGGYAGYRIGSHSKFVYKDDGDRERDKEKKNFYLNNWRYGVRFQLGYRGVDFYANYDLNDLFVVGKGPQLNAFSFGIIL